MSDTLAAAGASNSALNEDEDSAGLETLTAENISLSHRKSMLYEIYTFR